MDLESKTFLTGTVFFHFESSGELTDEYVQPKLVKTELHIYKSNMVKLGLKLFKDFVIKTVTSCYISFILFSVCGWRDYLKI